MKNYFASTLLFVGILLMAMLGCQEDDSNPATPVSEAVQYSIEIIGLPEEITAPEESTREFPFTVRVVDVTNLTPAKAIAVGMVVASGQGIIGDTDFKTNDIGQLEAVYTITLPRGNNSATILVTVGGDAIQQNINLTGLNSPHRIILNVSPEEVVNPPDGVAEININATVTDAEGAGIPGIHLKLALLPYESNPIFGSINPATTADETGGISSVFRSINSYGIQLLRCSVDEGIEFEDVFAEKLISVEGIISTGAIIQLQSDRDSIYADNGISQAVLTVVLKDNLYRAVKGETIFLTSNNNGTVSSPVVTDSLGIARAIFRDIGLPSGYEVDGVFYRRPCTIKASSAKYQVSDSVNIDIKSQRAVDNIVISAGGSRMQAGETDSTWVSAICYTDRERANPTPEGTTVRFRVNDRQFGRFTDSEVHVTGSGGTASTVYISGGRVGTARIWAEVTNFDGRLIRSDKWSILLDPGPPDRIGVNADPHTIQIDEPNALVRIMATVSDQGNNPIADHSVQVHFQSVLGAVNPVSAFTEEGIAIAYLTPGITAGLDRITATVETPDGPVSALTAVNFTAGGGASLSLSAHPPVIAAPNTGGNSVSRLRALVKDSYGNPVIVRTLVVFVLESNDEPPTGCRINNVDAPFEYHSDTVLTQNGVAEVLLNAGTRPGPQLIRAYTLKPDSSESGVSATYSNLTVTGGEPTSISLDYNTEARDIGGGMWAMEIAARVYDMYNNPASDSIPVIFTVSPDIASISQGMTRNRGMNGHSTPGVAYATLTYNSSHTFDTVRVEAYCRTDQVDSLGAARVLPLPLQNGQLTLHADPGQWMFNRGTRDSSEIRVWAVLRDGHGVEINNAPIMFNSNRANFFYIWRLNPSPAFKRFRDGNNNRAPTRRLTGPGNDGINAAERQADNDPDGQSVVWLRGWEYDYFLNDYSMETSARVEAVVEGYDDVIAQPVTVIITRRDRE